MALIHWKEEYGIGIQKIDDQHKIIFGIINNLYDIMQTSSEHDGLDEILQQLVSYADYHFADEEEYFKKFGYKDIEAHIAIHHSYRDKINTFIQEYKEDGKFLSFKLLDFLEDWWIGHVTDVDKNYAEYFKQHGLA